MASVKVKLRASSVPAKEGTLFYQVIHCRVARQINTGYKLHPCEWNTANAEIIFPQIPGNSRRNYLVSLKTALKDDISRLKKIISGLERSGQNYTADEIVKSFLAFPNKGGFISFGRELVLKLKQIGKTRTAERYTTILNSFERFRENKDVSFDDMVSGLMTEYEIFLAAKGVCLNSSSFYMRGLRAIYNRAVEKDLTLQRSPFKYVYTGIDKTVKRAVPLKIIRQIRELDLTLFPAADFARDIFMFSFYTRGMSFIDMAYLKKKDLKNGFLSYRRQKTGQQLFIKWEMPMQEIIDKYDTAGTPYLLPIIKNMDMDEYKQYKNAAHLVNTRLKKLGAEMRLTVPLTSYVARHAWASIAKSKNVPLATISEAMGHDSEKTTRIYLASLDTSAVDKANMQIIKSL